MRYATMSLGSDKTSIKAWGNNECSSCGPLQRVIPSSLISREVAFNKLYKISFPKFKPLSESSLTISISKNKGLYFNPNVLLKERTICELAGLQKNVK